MQEGSPGIAASVGREFRMQEVKVRMKVEPSEYGGAVARIATPEICYLPYFQRRRIYLKFGELKIGLN